MERRAFSRTRKRLNGLASPPRRGHGRIAPVFQHAITCGTHRYPASTNPKSETRNPKQAANSNDKFSKRDRSARPRRLGFEDLLLCSLEFVSDFGFRNLPAVPMRHIH